MKDTTMRQTIEDIVRAMTPGAANGRHRSPRAPRVPRNLRPARARSTFRLPADVQVSRRVTA